MLKELISQSSNRDDDHWLDVNALCDYHPDEPKKPTVYGWVHSGRIPCHSKGKKLYFLKSEIDAWLKAGRKKTVEEIKAEASQYVKGKGVRNGR